MANHDQHDENYNSNPGVMYESSDANVRGIYTFGIWLAVLGVLCALATWGGLRGLEVWEVHQNKARMAENPMVPEARMKMTPEQTVHEFPSGNATPRLQVNDTADMNDELQEENAKLSHYQWIDQGQGVVRIPIDKAMQLIVQRGLPARAVGAVAAPAPVGKAAAKPAAAKKPMANPPGKPASQQVR